MTWRPLSTASTQWSGTWGATNTITGIVIIIFNTLVIIIIIIKVCVIITGLPRPEQGQGQGQEGQGQGRLRRLGQRLGRGLRRQEQGHRRHRLRYHITSNNEYVTEVYNAKGLL